MHLAVALEGAGWHPAAWREPRARPAELFTARYWVDQITEAERGLLDFVTIEDGFSVQSSRTDQVTGRLDAVLIAARAAPVTRHIGLVPTVVVTHTEPFHVSKAIATLDYASRGRAGLRVRVSSDARECALFGRREPPEGTASLLAEAADYVEVVRRLWDSWEDDAEIRDAETGRFADRNRLHYIDFSGEFFRVRGPSITPRPPQGQPVVAAFAHEQAHAHEHEHADARTPAPAHLDDNSKKRPGLGRGGGALSADVGFVTPGDAVHARELVSELGDVRVFADLVVFLGHSVDEAAGRKARLDERVGYAYTSDATIFTGTPGQLAGLLLEWREAGLDGFRLRPGTIPDDLELITRGLVPRLQAGGAFRTNYEASTLRGLLGLARPANRYATSGVA